MKMTSQARPPVGGVFFLSVALTGAAFAEVVMKLEDQGRMALAHPPDAHFQIWSDWSEDIKVGLINRFVEPNLSRTLGIDFNEDGQDEIVLSGNLFGTRAATKGTTQVAAEEIEGTQNGGSYAWAFTRDQMIGPAEVILFAAPERIVWTSNAINGGNSAMAAGRNLDPPYPGLYFQITPSSQLFLGVRFQIQGRWHYGWVMVMGSRDNDALPIAGWAYETEPDTPIKTGPVLFARPEGPFSPTQGAKSTFRDADADGSGGLTITEYSEVQPFGSRRTTAIHRFRFLDSDGDGTVSVTEFLQGKGGAAAGSPSLLRSFLLADQDGDGLMQAGEWPLWYLSASSSIRVMLAFDRKERIGQPRGSLFHGSLTPEEFGVSSRWLRKASVRFAARDADRNATLSFEEFASEAPSNISLAWLRDLFHLSDIDGSGDLVILEHAASEDVCPPPAGARLFNLADLDDDGCLDPSEFSDTKSQETDWFKVMKEFNRKDLNKDSKLQVVEF